MDDSKPLFSKRIRSNNIRHPSSEELPQEALDKAIADIFNEAPVRATYCKTLLKRMALISLDPGEASPVDFYDDLPSFDWGKMVQHFNVVVNKVDDDLNFPDTSIHSFKAVENRLKEGIEEFAEDPSTKINLFHIV